MTLRATLLCALLAAPGPLSAQGAGVEFGGLSQDTSLPVEVTSDELQVDQSNGSALFIGDVTVTQGQMRLSADRIEVSYAGADQGRIETLTATGGVTLVNGQDAAEGQEAVYDIDAGSVVMTGDVLLTQGQTALSGDRLDIDLTTGTGQMRGGVRTIFRTGQDR